MAPKRPKYYTPNEVSVHNTPKDLWASFLGKVYNLTPLCQQFAGDTLLRPIITAAGKDISHWFHPKTKGGCLRVLTFHFVCECVCVCQCSAKKL